MRFERHIRFNAPIESVWRLLADTDRLNQEVGLPPIRFDFEPQQEGGTRAYGNVQVAGMKLRYREHPFDWVRPQFHRVKRTFERGPVKEAVLGTELAARGGGTDVLAWAEMVPNGPTGTIFCRAMGMKSMSDFERTCVSFQQFLDTKAPTPYPKQSIRPPTDEQRLSELAKLVAGSVSRKDILERLCQYLREATPKDCLQLRPFALADNWGEDRYSVLETMLHAARAGMLNLKWRIRCPNCRGGKPEGFTLGEVDQTVHCPTCNIAYDSYFDQNVEALFSVTPAIRPVQRTTYCVGGPELTPHIVAQLVLEPRSHQNSVIRISEGRHRIYAVQAANEFEANTSPLSPPEVQLVVSENGSLNLSPPDSLPTEGAWTLENRSDLAVTVRIATTKDVVDGASAALVTSIQCFRDLFSAEVLSLDAEVGVERMCFLFTDLKGSTAMYRERGDAQSYRIVRDHFSSMRKTVARYRGAIVKTIGDAIMATFYDPADGLLAAIEIQNEHRDLPDSLTVKVGIAYGPAIAVNANDAIDYFGHTVNLAARVQSESLGGDIVLSSEMAEDCRVADLLRDSGWVGSHYETTVRGIAEPISLIRLTR